MPLFQITRQLPSWTQEEIEAGSVRTQMCVGWFEGLRWIRSYQDPEREISTCIYESPDADTIRRHSLISEVPADEIHEVREWLPEADPPESADSAIAERPVRSAASELTPIEAQR